MRNRGQNRTREIRPSGIVEGLQETWPVGDELHAARAPDFYLDQRTLGSARGAARKGGPYRECAQHDQQLGGASPLWRLMAPTTSQWQLRRREAGWGGSRRRSRDPRNTWRAAIAAAGCAYEAGRSGRAGSAWRSPMSIKGPSRRRGGCAMKGAGLTWGDLRGRPRCPVLQIAGVARDSGVREGVVRRGEVSRGRTVRRAVHVPSWFKSSRTDSKRGP